MSEVFSIGELKEICFNPHVCGICLKPSMHIDGHLCYTCRDIVPRMLPVVSIRDGKLYFFDKRLRQMRNINNPHDYINLL